MNIIVCLDNNRGMMFNRRRQSRDKYLIDKIKELTANHTTWTTPYSASLFDWKISIDENMLSLAKKDDFCFVENLHVQDHLSSIDKIYLFKWNRTYPADFYFDIDLNEEFHLISQEDFTGNSHENITMEVWER